MEIDYKFCSDSKLCIGDLLIWLDLDQYFDDGYSTVLFDRYIRVCCEVIQVSCVSSDFDRWANSYEFEFDIRKSAQRRRFVKWVKEQRELS